MTGTPSLPPMVADVLAAKPTRLCGCGCGAPVAKRYKPGHDAKHKGAMLDTIRTGARMDAERAAWQMIDLGWGGKIDPAFLHSLPQRNRRGQVKRHIESVQRFLVATNGVHHANAACPCLTDHAKRTGAIHPITKLARPSAFQLVDSTPSLVHHLRHSFDQCHECTVDETVLERIESEVIECWLSTEVASLAQQAAINRARAAEALATPPVGPADPSLPPPSALNRVA